MNPDFHPIINGIYLILGIQLLIVAALQFIYSPKKQYALAFLCLILSEWFFRRFFWDIWKQHSLLIILIGGYKEVFIAPLAYFHLLLKRRNIKWKEILFHLLLPTLLFLRYVISRIFFPEFYNGTKLIGFWSLIIFLSCSYSVYLALGYFELNKSLKGKILSKAYKRIALFFYIILGYHIISLTTTFLSQFAIKVRPESQFWSYLNNTIIYNFDWYFQRPLLIIISMLLIVYALSETPYFKKLFINKNILIEPISNQTIKAISEKVSHKFHVEKIHTNTTLNLELTLSNLGVSKKDFVQYLNHHSFANFSEFVNRLRVNEFKELVKDQNNKKYDMVSISLKAGFNSKATFNRVFKKMEGITPSQYIDTL